MKNKYIVRYTDSPSCEHCGENFDDFAAEFQENGGPTWCIDCFVIDNELSEEEEEEIMKEEKRLKIQYYKDKIKELEKE